MSQTLDVEKAVKDRYSEGAKAKVDELCCPVNYNKKYLDVLPAEIVERDYGCGDPSAELKPDETVLDLGSGGGKICYIAAQVVGPKGRVIGIDMNDDMLGLARKYQRAIGDRLGYHNVDFRRGKIQDLGLDYSRLDDHLKNMPITSLSDYQELEKTIQRWRSEDPMIRSDSIDVVVSNCVLNLVEPAAKEHLFGEMFRVLKKSGRAVISDVVSDEPPTDKIKNDPELWSGCIAGAFQEQDFLKAFEKAGFYGITLLKREEKPWRTIDGVEFRSVTVQAYKGKQGPCWETNKAVIYKGPWIQVKDDDNHTFVRGVPIAVCEKTFELMMREPYGGQLEAVRPLTEIPLAQAKPFDCSIDAVRHPKQTKGQEYHATDSFKDGTCCAPGTC
jgi:arsenite methyltransferase